VVEPIFGPRFLTHTCASDLQPRLPPCALPSVRYPSARRPLPGFSSTIDSSVGPPLLLRGGECQGCAIRGHSPVPVAGTCNHGPIPNTSFVLPSMHTPFFSSLPSPQNVAIMWGLKDNVYLLCWSMAQILAGVAGVAHLEDGGVRWAMGHGPRERGGRRPPRRAALLRSCEPTGGGRQAKGGRRRGERTRAAGERGERCQPMATPNCRPGEHGRCPPPQRIAPLRSWEPIGGGRRAGGGRRRDKSTRIAGERESAAGQRATRTAGRESTAHGGRRSAPRL